MKTLYKLLFSMLFFPSILYAQEEVQQFAVATCSDPWNWNTINDLTKGPSCGGQTAFVWTSGPPHPTNDWMQWVWNDVMVISHLKIWHAQTTGRFLTGGTIQGWNGSAWYDFYTFSGLNQSNCENTVTLPTPLVSTRMRINRFVPGTGQNSNMNYREIEIWAFRSDIRMDNITIYPNPVCSDHLADVTIELTNLGPGPAPRIELGIDMEGQSRINRTLILNNLAPGRDTTITIPNIFKTNILGTNLKVRAINTQGDINATNDTAETLLNVLPSPFGSVFAPVQPFDGRIDLGIHGYPDMTNSRKTIEYEITPPNGYSNADYGNTWDITNISETVNGTPIPSNFFTLTNPASGSNGKLAVSFPDNYEDSTINLKYLISSIGNGCDTIVSRQVYIAALVRVNFTFSAACAFEPLIFTNLSSLAKGAPKYIWYFGDGSDSVETFADPEHTYTTSGTYNVTLVGITDLGFRTDTTITISVTPTPTVDFSFKNACMGEPIELKGNANISAGTLSYTWTLGDGITSNQTDINHQYATHGMYEVNLYVESQLGCNATITKQVQQHPLPVADFNLPTTPQCFSAPIHFLNQSTIPYTKVGYDWKLEDGTKYSTLNASHQFISAGATDVKLVATSEFGCLDSVIKTLILLPTPIVDFEVYETCLNGNALLSGTSDVTGGQNIAYTWKTGDGMMLNGSQTQHTYTTLGSKTVELEVVFDNGCSGMLSKQITVQERPTAGFEVPAVCDGEATRFVNTSKFTNGQLSSNWQFGDGNGSTVFNPEYTYPSTGTFEVVLIASTGTSCTDTFKLMHIVNEMPVCDFDWEIDWTLGYEPGKRSIKFTPANTNYDSYRWFFGNFSNSTQTEPSYKFPSDGNFEVRMIAKTAEGCECQSTQNVSVSTTGLPLVETGDIRFYPNPATDYMNVENLTANNKSMNFTILDQTGRTLQTGTLNQGNNRIDLGTLANGTYYIRMTVDGMSGTYPFVVVK
jgi:PKD repeat protein